MSKAKKERVRMRKLAEEVYKNPEGQSCFTFTPERYYLGMWMVELPKELCRFRAPMGDVTIQVFRKHDEPMNWSVTWRFRYYHSNDPWDTEDHKRWFCGSAKDTFESEMEDKLREMLVPLALGASAIAGKKLNLKMSPWLIKGDGNKAMELLEKNPPDWMHVRTSDSPEGKEYLKKLEGKE